MAKVNKLIKASGGKSASKPSMSTATGGPSEPRPYVPTKADRDREMRYKAEDTLRSMEQINKAKSDPALMKVVKQMASEKIAALSGVLKAK